MAARTAARWKPEPKDQALVESLTAFGLPVAEQLLLVRGPNGRALSADEFGQFFADQIKRGRAKANAALGQALYKRALNGDARAFREWQKQTTSETVETRELMQWLGVSGVVIADMERRRVIHKVAHGLYSLRDTIAAVIAHYLNVIESRGGAEAIGGLVGARARLAREQADQIAMRNAAMREELVPLREVNVKLKECNQIVGERLLALPSEMAPQLHACSTVLEHQTLMRTLLCEALEKMCKEFGSERRSNGSAGAPAGA